MNRVCSRFALTICVPLLVIVFSCVPRKKEIYIQNQNTFEETGADTVTLEYDLPEFEHKLSPGDVIDIKVTTITPSEYDFFATERDNNYNNNDSRILEGYKVNSDGNVRLPVLGEVALMGLTLEEAEEKIRTSISGLLREPAVTINMLNYNFTVLGEVVRPGEYRTYDKRINFFEAVAQAGDLNDFADREKIQILRYHQEKAEVAFVNVLEEDFLGSEYYYIRPNDVILVPPTKTKNFKKYQLANIGIFLSLVTVISLLIVRTN